jgi:hypothetical protein
LRPTRNSPRVAPGCGVLTRQWCCTGDDVGDHGSSAVVAGEHAGGGGTRPTPVMAKGDCMWLGLESGSSGKAAGAVGGGIAEALSEGGGCLREGDMDPDGEGERERERVGEREKEAAEGEGDGDSGR